MLSVWACLQLEIWKKHVKSKHNGVRYPCSHCEHASTRAGGLKIHFENKHEGVRYPCSQCEHAATANYLKRK